MGTTSLPTEYVHRAAWKAAVMGTLNVLTAILAARAILLIAVCGAFALAILSLSQADPYRMGVLIVYAVLVVVPMVVLSLYRA